MTKNYRKLRKGVKKLDKNEGENLRKNVKKIQTKIGEEWQK